MPLSREDMIWGPRLTARSSSRSIRPDMDQTPRASPSRVDPWSKSWGVSDLMATTERVCVLLERLGVRRAGGEGEPCKVVVDVVGLGGGVRDRLRELGYWTIEFNGGEQPRQPERFLNRRAECHWYLREQLEAGLVALPDDKDLIDELLSIRWSPTTQSKIRTEAKDQLAVLHWPVA